MAIDQDVLRQIRTEEGGAPAVDLIWLELDSQWGVRAKPGKRGLTLDEINVGPCAPPADGEPSRNVTMLQPGAVPRPGVPRAGYHLEKKSDVWSQNATLLYEEAVQRQWSSATDIPWEELEPLPDGLERAMCQLCTFGPEVSEALIIFLGGGRKNVNEGVNRMMALQKRQVTEYVHRLHVAGMTGRVTRLAPFMGVLYNM